MLSLVLLAARAYAELPLANLIAVRIRCFEFVVVVVSPQNLLLIMQRTSRQHNNTDPITSAIANADSLRVVKWTIFEISLPTSLVVC